MLLYAQIATETQLADRARLEQTIEDLETGLQSVRTTHNCPAVLLYSRHVLKYNSAVPFACIFSENSLLHLYLILSMMCTA